MVAFFPCAFRAQDAQSAHFVEIDMFRVVSVAFGNIILNRFDHIKSKGGVLEHSQKHLLKFKFQSQQTHNK
jgi:hypothetical protein